MFVDLLLRLLEVLPLLARNVVRKIWNVDPADEHGVEF